MKYISWSCDWCGSTAQGSSPPAGWPEVSYFDPQLQKQKRHIFCSWEHLAEWSHNQAIRREGAGVGNGSNAI